MNIDKLYRIRDEIRAANESEASKYELIESRLSKTIDAYVSDLDDSISYLNSHDSFKALKSFNRGDSKHEIDR